ncbi:MAG: protocatechuate 3,4-dioxygenase subunit alpha, partial [Methylobacteriaceae bacterium]|nr:protocatechuate 3,4-dioxygenase subunit alpha [Methylobacteriaceae bacterium]
YRYPALVGNDLLTEDAVGEPICIEGRVLDGAGSPVPDAMIEIWQADGAGRYAGNDSAPLPNTAFKGFGRCATDREGNFSFRTLKPGSVPAPDGRPQAPHINIGLFARGLLRRLFTRIYFEGEAANDADPVLALVPHEARKTLIARRTESEGAAAYVFDIRLQGDDETVFFEA